MFQEGVFSSIEDFEPLIVQTGLGRKQFPNPGVFSGEDECYALLPAAIEKAAWWMSEQRKGFEDRINKKLNEQLAALERLRGKQHDQLEFRFKDSRLPERIVKGIKERERRRIDRLFDEYLDWVQDTMTTEDNPYIQLIAVLKGIN